MAPRAHARLSPSSASRWINCAASVGAIEEEDIEDEAGLNADEGSILHSFCEDALKTGTSPYSYVGETREYNEATLELTDELADMMQEGIDLIDEFPGDLYVEKKLDLGRWMPGQFGTMDVGIVNARRSVCFDWKWGYQPVSPVENDQLRIYALGFWWNYVRHMEPDCKKFKLIIFQPRAPGGGGEWDIHLDDLLDFGETVKKAAKRTYDPKAEFNPGEKQCTYCPLAKNLVCDAYKAYNIKMFIDDLDAVDEEIEMGIPLRLSNKLITPERRSHIIKNRTMINKFLDRLQAEALDDALKGRPTPGLKAVDGRSPARRWRDEEEAKEEILKVLDEEKAFRPARIISPTQFEKEVSESTYNRLKKALVNFGEKKAVLVPEEDSRPAKASLVDEFDQGD